MHETPYELLLKKSRQRKIELINSIEEKSLKHRSISYNMHIQNDLTENPQTKPKDKQKHEKQIRINYTSCLKKSYYYRKFLNQSVEGHLTHDQFAKLKEILNRIGVHHSQTEKNPAIFREIWENEIQRKHSLRTDEEKQLQLTVKPKTNDKNFTDFLGYSSEQRKQAEEAKKKLEDITQIAQKRKQSFDFDLEIQGNKKDIRAKDGNHSKSPKKITNTKDTLEGYLFNMEQNKTIQQAQILPSHQKNKTACTFFKRFQQSNTKTGTEPQQNISIKIKKISPDRRQLIEDDDKTFVSKHSRAYRSSLTRQLVQTLESRDIRSTWNGSSNENRKQRYHKVQTAQKCRISIRRHKKLVGCTYTNDIQGWNVKAQNEDQTNEVFGA